MDGSQRHDKMKKTNKFAFFCCQDLYIPNFCCNFAPNFVKTLKNNL